MYTIFVNLRHRYACKIIHFRLILSVVSKTQGYYVVSYLLLIVEKNIHNTCTSKPFQMYQFCIVLNPEFLIRLFNQCKTYSTGKSKIYTNIMNADVLLEVKLQMVFSHQNLNTGVFSLVILINTVRHRNKVTC